MAPAERPRRRPPAPAARRRAQDVRAGGARRPRPVWHVPDEVVAELRATARPGKREIVVQLFGEAAGAFAAGDHATAVRLGEQAKRLALRSAAVRELLGIAHYRAGAWAEAARELAAFRRLSGTTEQNPVLADCYRALGRPDKALAYCDEVARGEVTEAVYYEAQIVAAGALADSNRLDEAIARLERLDLAPEVAAEHHLRAWYALADLLERAGRYGAARAYFEAVAATDPELTDAAERAARLR